MFAALALALLAMAAWRGDAAGAESPGPGYPPGVLTVWNRPIAVFRAPVRQVSPVERATLAGRRIEALLDDLQPEDVTFQPAEIGDLQGVTVTAKQNLLFGILKEDLDVSAGETLEVAGQRAVDRLAEVLRTRAEQRRLPVLLTGVALTLIATAVLGVVLVGLVRVMGRMLAGLRRGTASRPPKIAGLDIWPFLNAIERTMVRATAWSLGAVAAYLWLTFVLHQFPYTRPWGGQLRGFLLSVLADLGSRALGAMPGLFTVMVIFLAARLITRAIGGFFSAVDAGTVSLPGLDIDTARATRRIVTTLVWLFALTVAYPYIPGSETEAFKAIGVFAGLMVTLGSAGFIGQVMSGLMVVYSRALKPGELVRVNDVVGMVSEVGMLSTRIVSPTREEITIPNASLVGSTVTNYSRLASENGVTFVSTAVTIGYDVPWRQVHGLLVRAAERTPGIRAAPPAYVVQRALSDFYVDYELRAPLVRAEERFRVLSDLHAQIQDAFNEFGVQIMSPNFEAQPDKPVLVPKSDWFTPPAAPPDGGSAGEGR